MKYTNSFLLLLTISTLVACQTEKDITDCQGNNVQVERPENTTSGVLGLVAQTENTQFAIQSGDWSDPCTWENGKVPQSGAKLLIPKDIVVTVDTELEAEIETIKMKKALSFE